MTKAIPFPTDTPETAHIKSLQRIGFAYGAIAAAVFATAVFVSSQALHDKTTDYAAASVSGAVR